MNRRRLLGVVGAAAALVLVLLTGPALSAQLTVDRLSDIRRVEGRGDDDVLSRRDRAHAVTGETRRGTTGRTELSFVAIGGVAIALAALAARKLGPSIGAVASVGTAARPLSRGPPCTLA